MNKKQDTIIIILAAGKGTRMNSDLPKVLHLLNDKTLLDHVIDTSNKINPKDIIVVVGYKKEMIIENLKTQNITIVEQKSQKGTADAIKYCLPKIKKFNGNILILSGDVPMIKFETLKQLINTHNSNNSLASLISAKLNDPTGYGRIIKNHTNQLIKIIEHKDATDEEREINEINSGIYIFNSNILIESIPLINNNNVQKEYYLTDIFNFINEDDTAIHEIKDYNEIAGINTIEQLEELERNL
jgi:UDP-N-acetylglucosamine diphosphorylase/glucosamine-1-phosphate N-acetyltransferase